MPQLAFILEVAKGTRDAIMHASPFPLVPEEWDASKTVGEQVRFGKQEILLNLSVEKLDSLVDSVVSVIQKIEIGIHGDTKHLSWLMPRDTNGRFPAEAFD